MLAGLVMLVGGLTVIQAQEANAAYSRCVRDGSYYRACATVYRHLYNKRQVKYRTSVTNDLPRPVSGQCSMSKTQTWTFGLSFSAQWRVKAAVFASMQATFGGNLEYSSTTTRSTSVTFSVAPRETVFCDWGTVATYASGLTSQEWWGPYRRTQRSFVAQAHNYDNWHIYR